MAKDKSETAGVLRFGGFVTCSKCGDQCLVSNIFSSAVALIMNLLKNMWTVDRKGKWTCCACSYGKGKKPTRPKGFNFKI